jgi:outer membrane protein OmpA-like peptidoglycan-associated protein
MPAPSAAPPPAAANVSQDIVPEAPPPPPFELPARPAPAPAPPALAALPPPQLAPAPAAPPAPRVAPAPPEGASAQVAVIYFGDGKAALDADADKVLDQVASLYRLRGGTVRVVGYSGTPADRGDLVRSSMAALNLASSRADAVANGLVRHGVRREVIQRSASSEAPPLLEGGRSTGLAGTRRAEIWLDY